MHSNTDQNFYAHSIIYTILHSNFNKNQNPHVELYAYFNEN